MNGRRTDRCYRIYPMVYDPNFHELEYFVALERGPEALAAMRELMLASLPDSVYPLEVRTVGPDDAFLSPNYMTATTVISVSGTPGTCDRLSGIAHAGLGTLTRGWRSARCLPPTPRQSTAACWGIPRWRPGFAPAGRSRWTSARRW